MRSNRQIYPKETNKQISNEEKMERITKLHKLLTIEVEQLKEFAGKLKVEYPEIFK